MTRDLLTHILRCRCRINWPKGARCLSRVRDAFTCAGRTCPTRARPQPCDLAGLFFSVLFRVLLFVLPFSPGPAFSSRPQGRLRSRSYRCSAPQGTPRRAAAAPAKCKVATPALPAPSPPAVSSCPLTPRRSLSSRRTRNPFSYPVRLV